MAKWHAKLVKDGHIGADQLQEAEAIARKKAKKVEAILVELGYVTSDVLRQYQTAALGYEMVDLKAIEVDASVIEQVPESVARENVVFPVEMRGDSLVVALNDPMNLEVLDKLRFILNRDVQVVVAPTEAIQAAINAHYGQHQNESVDSIIAEFTETAIDFTETELAGAEAEADADESSPIVKLVNLIISEAVNMRASDIHIEPFEDRVRIRYRIDGVLVERDSPPKRLLSALSSRLKIMGSIDISERRAHRTVASRHVSTVAISICESVFSPRTTARRWCSAFWTATILKLGFAIWGLVNRITRIFRKSSGDRMEFFW